MAKVWHRKNTLISDQNMYYSSGDVKNTIKNIFMRKSSRSNGINLTGDNFSNNFVMTRDIITLQSIDQEQIDLQKFEGG